MLSTYHKKWIYENPMNCDNIYKTNYFFFTYCKSKIKKNEIKIRFIYADMR